MTSRVFLSFILLSIAVSSALAITCQTCNLTTTREACSQNYESTNCDNVKLDETNITADSCFTMNATKLDGSPVFIQHCTLKAGCDYICSYFNRTHLAYTLKTCQANCFVESITPSTAPSTAPFTNPSTTPSPISSTTPSTTTQKPPTTSGNRVDLAFGLIAAPIFIWLLH
ncbi:G8 domain-containing protein DDB_G0286311-like [Actinia tenebrosa]|uniref:G8 domain-containing protein DDB_G0286311-like n=1 Tax=Actinia tenebrosa TaxID=6105 RepID=A0A6P8J1Z2_ACTTE|nr:G8 domain-containing protein DDB_G0286311-like [Actinia tenebrosa]